MWTKANRAKYNRDRLRYPSDVTDEEWGHVAPLIPPAKRGGRKREVDMREVFNAIMYVLSTGCQWRYIPKDFPRRAQCIVIFAIGPGAAFWIACTTRSTSCVANKRNERRAPPRRSSIVRA